MLVRVHPLKACAVVFLLVMSAYGAAAIYYNRHDFPNATIGATSVPTAGEAAMRIEQVAERGPAERAGLRRGDLVRAVNGQPLLTAYPYWDSIDRGTPGATVTLAVERPGEPDVRRVRIELEAPPAMTDIAGAPITPARLAALHVLSFYPIPFIIVTAVVLLQRSHDSHAWLLAVLLASFSAGMRPIDLEPIIHPALRKPLIAYCLLWSLVPQGALYYFFASFPEPTPLDRRVPWLKVVLLALPFLIGASLALVTLLSPETPFYLRPRGLAPTSQAWVDFSIGMYSVAGYGLGLGSLAWNAFRGRPETRRRTRMMLWGTAGAVLPITILGSCAVIHGMQLTDFPFWVWVGAILAIFLLPLSFAYAVVKHRVMEIPVLLRRSARYVVVHRAIVSVGIVVGIVLTFAFAALFSRVLPEGSHPAVVAGSAVTIGLVESHGYMTETERRALSGVAGAIFGVLITLATRKGVNKVTQRLDRAFFREAYDARQLLHEVARRTRSAVDRRQLAELLEQSLEDALHPSTILVLLRTRTDRLEPIDAPPESDLLSMDAAAVEREPGIRSGVTVVKPGELPSSLAPLAVTQPDLLAPMQGHDERLEGLLVLGPRLSDEPYGREDRELVASVAGQAGIALQNLRLAGVIAERMEAERRAEHELEIAREVQAKLLPQRAPVFESLDYAGICIQARQVGGDYYDFFYLGPGRLGLVLADVSGKGISAALLMASLQASLRSHYAWAPEDLPRILHAVNRTFFESTETSRYATLFFGIYDEASALLRYANCGHLPPVLLGADGSLQRLTSTAPVIGLFEDWRCEIREVQLERGDTLAIFSDGVVEALDVSDEEFGEERLVDLLRQHKSLSADLIVKTVVDEVQRHSGPTPSDDFTLIVARGQGERDYDADRFEEHLQSAAAGMRS
jgi:sigma-B regulation protein RsbU (phosphoserine phosphatase)